MLNMKVSINIQNSTGNGLWSVRYNKHGYILATSLQDAIKKAYNLKRKYA